MKLAYTVALEDMVAFNDYHWQHSPFARRTRTKLAIYTPLSIVIVLGLMSLVIGSWIYLVMGVIVAAISAAITPSRFRKHMRRAAEKCYTEGQNKGLIGRHEIEITGDGISEKNPTGSNSTCWAGIERVEQNPTHGFIYVSSNAAHVIPIASVTEGDFQEFMQVMRARCDKNNPQPPASNDAATRRV